MLGGWSYGLPRPKRCRRGGPLLEGVWSTGAPGRSWPQTPPYGAGFQASAPGRPTRSATRRFPRSRRPLSVPDRPGDDCTCSNCTSLFSPFLVRLPAADGDQHPVAVVRVVDTSPPRALTSLRRIAAGRSSTTAAPPPSPPADPLRTRLVPAPAARAQGKRDPNHVGSPGRACRPGRWRPVVTRGGDGGAPSGGPTDRSPRSPSNEDVPPSRRADHSAGHRVLYGRGTMEITRLKFERFTAFSQLDFVPSPGIDAPAPPGGLG